VAKKYYKKVLRGDGGKREGEKKYEGVGEGLEGMID
jgi:hypothetical protein